MLSNIPSTSSVYKDDEDVSTINSTTKREI